MIIPSQPNVADCIEYCRHCVDIWRSYIIATAAYLERKHLGVTTLRRRLSSSRMNGVRFDSRPQRRTITGDIKISSVAVGAIGWLDLQSSHSTIMPATYLWWF